MERFSSYERVVGKISESSKKEILDEEAAIFRDQDISGLEKVEQPKTPEQIAILELVNTETNEVLRRYGLEPFDIPPKNYHVIKESEWKGRGVAFYRPTLQFVAMVEQPANIVFMAKAFHETLHFKSYNALQVTLGETGERKDYRIGLVVTSRDGKREFFRHLNEAVTEELTKQYVEKLKQDSLFASDNQCTTETIAKHPNAVAYTGEPLYDDQTYYATVLKRTWGESLGRLFGMGDRGRISTESFTYVPERRILAALIEKLKQKNQDEFRDRSEVFDIFATAMLTGNILPIGKLIDRSFGVGTFRAIGEIEKVAELESYVRSLT